jgi:hypothetical protein
VLAVILAALASRLLRISFAILAALSRLAFAFAFNFFKPRPKQLYLFEQHVNYGLLLFKQRLAVRAIGGALGQFHDQQFLVDSPRILRSGTNYRERRVDSQSEFQP